MRQIGSVLWPKLRALQVYGANTGVGKTVFCNALASNFSQKLKTVYYLKPVSTGPQQEADDVHISSFGHNVHSKCLYQFSDPVSPHLAARSSPERITDSAIQAAVFDELQSYAKSGTDAVSIVETAGGVLSPSPSGSSQADLYRPLRLPVLLIGDDRLGGIGTTISAWESLHLRGYDVKSVALFAEQRYDNHSYLKEYFGERNISAFSVPPPPERKQNAEQDAKSMRAYYADLSAHAAISDFTASFLHDHDERMKQLQAMPAEAEKTIWHPFLQHRERSKDTIVAMESAYGDHFQTYTTKQQHGDRPTDNLLKPAFDGSASWWTQGLGHGNPQLALTAAYAAGRYGHVMFAGAVHEPALRLAETLIEKMGNSKLSRVFYTDNGSTGMEVAVKMALRTATVRNGGRPAGEVSVLGLKGSYHGDTIGVMDCSEPNIYNEKVEWYKGRGLWLDFPQVKMRQGRWMVEIPGSSSRQHELQPFDSLDSIFDFDRRTADRAQYMETLWTYKDDHAFAGPLGALILEPVLLGAGGMMFADPLFQRCLVDAVREDPSHYLRLPTRSGQPKASTPLPVIFDEVFTGLYRLGRFSAASFLGARADPDIVVNAKLLTGGLLPLCTTAASEEVFDAFLSEDKSDALLHGHSYTAHAVGCAVGRESLRNMEGIARDGGQWEGFRGDWRSTELVAESSTAKGVGEGAWSMWSHHFVAALSHRPNVDYVFALGSVLAVSLRDPQGAGYASTAAAGLRDHLFAGSGSGDDGWVVHSRVLGNVLYLMAAMTTSRETLKGVEGKVLEAIE